MYWMGCRFLRGESKTWPSLKLTNRTEKNSGRGVLTPQHFRKMLIDFNWFFKGDGNLHLMFLCFRNWGFLSPEPFREVGQTRSAFTPKIEIRPWELDSSYLESWNSTSWLDKKNRNWWSCFLTKISRLRWFFQIEVNRLKGTFIELVEVNGRVWSELVLKLIMKWLVKWIHMSVFVDRFL